MDHEPCEPLLEHLSDYLDGTASTSICAEIERHLVDCRDCQVVVDSLRKTITLYHSLPQPDMPEQLRERLYKELDLESYFVPKKS